MIYRPLQIEGTWEQIATLAPSLTGHRLRLTVLTKEETTAPPLAPVLPLSEQLARIREGSAENWESLPADLSEKHNHYLYGSSKK